MSARLPTARGLEVDLSRAETAPFEAGDGHRDLFSTAGSWVGRSRTWLDPDAEPEESATTARIEVILGGRFARMDYAGTVLGKPHAGAMLIGYEPEEGRFTSVWVDSFHASPAMLISTGPRSPDGVISLLGSYQAGGQRWGWRTVLRVVDDDQLQIDAFNISPEGREDRAIETILTRHKPG